MPLSKADLEQRMRKTTLTEERLVVEPYFDNATDDEKAAPASLDFHLGSRFVFLRRGRGPYHDPIDESQRSEASGTEVFIPLGANMYLHPGQLVLGTTLEWYRFPSDLMAYVVGRSIWGRRGLLVVTASAVQPNTSGTITLELSNIGEVAVRIRPGVALGQLFFHQVDPHQRTQKHPPFSVTHRPIFGTYKLSHVERVLVGMPENASATDV